MVRDLLGYLLPLSHTLPLTLVKRARLFRSGIRSIRVYLTAVVNPLHLCHFIIVQKLDAQPRTNSSNVPQY